MPDWVTAIVLIISTLLGAGGGFLASRAQAKKFNAEEAVFRAAARKEANLATEDAVAGAVDIMSKLVEGQHRRIEQLHKDVEASDVRANLLSERVHAANARIEAAECALREVQDNLRKAKETIAILERDLETARQENEILKQRLLELQDMQQVSEGERTRLQGEVDDLSERLAKYENRPQRTTAKRSA